MLYPGGHATANGSLLIVPVGGRPGLMPTGRVVDGDKELIGGREELIGRKLLRLLLIELSGGTEAVVGAGRGVEEAVGEI